MVECNICGKEFDSERGLNIHKSQVHEDEDHEQSETETSENQTDNRENSSDSVMFDDGSFNFSLSASHALVGVFLIGLVTGGFGYSLMDSTLMSDQAQMVESDNNPQPSGNQDTQDQAPSTDTVSMDQIEIEGEPVLGDENAPVTMVIYEDYQCPFCQRFEQNTMPQIVSNYVDSGDVKVVWKDLPLPQLGHEWADPAARAMECVYRQDEAAFWEVKKSVFDNQNVITSQSVVSDIKGYASQQGVSESAVQSCLDNENPMDEVNSDSQEARDLGVNGTPTIIINGQKVVGAQPFSRFESVIESELNG